MSIVSFAPTQDSKRLASVEHLREELGLTTTAQDGRLGRLIDRASARIEAYLQRDLRQGEVVEKLPPVDDSRLYLRRTPVKEVSEVLQRDEALVADEENGYTLENAASGVLYRRARWWVRLPYLYAITPTRSPEAGEEIYRVTYTAGYFLPEWVRPLADGDVPLPADIEDAALQLARRLYTATNRDPDVTSERLGDWSATYRDPGAGLSADLREMLGPHRRIVQA